jgi:serine protease AprX
MKKVIAVLLVILILASCAPAATAVPPIETSVGTQIEPYQDVRFKSLMDVTGTLDKALIETLWFNDTNGWPADAKPIADEVLKLGMNPGLGIRKLHAQGLTGQGVNVAIIDQNLAVALDHPEFQGKIVKYFDVGTKQPDDEGSMHGPAVASLLVGEQIGTAPGANLYFVSAPSWLADAQYYADALNWIIAENEKLPADHKIRVVSVSAAPSGPGSPFTKNNAAWDAAYQKATEADILVLDCTSNHGITAPCYYDLDDPEEVAKCTPGWPGMEFHSQPDKIYIPTSFRTTAEEYSKGEFRYQYTGRGGLSWSIPYLAGVLALGWQVNPHLTSARLLELVFLSAYTTEGGEKIIDPAAFIEMVKTAGSK